ncbi:zinc finger Y-chromosomal protein isoform X2 [Aethina tumida]|uniref:zinc finger Y-chromosomal protein isoform X2 n=1 Tax=Aethina tumida TaxID=116153 RepID=UPI00214953DE|nr:zinc finger Y-chromosomal protein isoform X2 [Aethina tumida]
MKSGKKRRYLLGCDVCETFSEGYCTGCGISKVLIDTFVEIGTKDRARKTLPKRVLSIASNQNGNMGVFALENIQSGVQMGPFEGLKNENLLDINDESQSNWMRYVNHATSFEESNVTAFQYEGDIFYRTSKEICKGDEILVSFNDIADQVSVEEEPIKEYFRCDYCDLCLTTDNFKKFHMRRCKWKFADEVPQSFFQCEHCQTYIADENYFKKHVTRCSHREIAKKKPIKKPEGKTCYDCGYTTISKTDLRRHIFTKHRKGDFVKFCCPHCDYTTVRKNTLTRHLKTHSDSRIFKCSYCDKRVSTKNNLYNHVLKEHKKENEEKNLVPLKCKIHQCPTCPYITVAKGHLVDHMRTCGNKTPLEMDRKNDRRKIKRLRCEHCHQEFHTKKYFDNHVLTKHPHTDSLQLITSKIFNCERCHYKTTISSNFKAHVKTHE